MLTIPARFNGPRSSGNGGWTAGALAAASGLPDPVKVRLRVPPPLDTPLDVVPVDGPLVGPLDGPLDGPRVGPVELRHGDQVVAVALPEGPASWTRFVPVGVAEARARESSYAGLRGHPFPRCFSCGTDRDDGLRIHPGRLDDARVAASWTPDESLLEDGLEVGVVPLPVTWAALDCVGGWSSDLEHRPLVLGQMCARVESPPQAGSSYAVVGVTRKVEGRKTWTASAMFDAAGRLVAQAEHLWIAVDAATVARLQS